MQTFMATFMVYGRRPNCYKILSVNYVGTLYPYCFANRIIGIQIVSSLYQNC